MRRRNFLAALGGAAAWQLAADAQPAPRPVAGLLFPSGEVHGEQYVVAFRKGLAEGGFVEGRDVALDVRWGNDDPDRVRAMAADLVRRGVSVILAGGTTTATVKAATTTIPIVFVIGIDPVRSGVVASLNRPGGNITGISTMNIDILPKWVGLMRELLPSARRFAVLFDPVNLLAAQSMRDKAHELGLSVGVEMEVVTAKSDQELDTAFANLAKTHPDALFIVPDELFNEHRDHLASLALRQRLPAIYALRDFPDVGGLMSYGSSFADAFQQAGLQAARILKGDRPSDIPIQRATRFEFVINLKTAKALSLTIPPTFLARADAVIE